MTRIALLGLAIAIAGASAVSAQTFMGAGTISCGEWLRFRSAEQNGNMQLKVSSFQAQAWIDGFLSGSNTNPGGPDFLASRLGGVASYTWLDNYCRSKPLDKLAEAAIALVEELRSRAGRK